MRTPIGGRDPGPWVYGAGPALVFTGSAHIITVVPSGVAYEVHRRCMEHGSSRYP